MLLLSRRINSRLYRNRDLKTKLDSVANACFYLHPLDNVTDLSFFTRDTSEAKNRTMKSFVVLAGILVLATAQRAPYAGSPNRRPQVIEHYKSTTLAPLNAPVAGRFGDTLGESGVPPKATYDAYNDPILLEQLAKLPREQQPFWYINREAIAAQGGLRVSVPTQPSTPFPNVNRNPVGRYARSSSKRHRRGTLVQSKNKYGSSGRLRR